MAENLLPPPFSHELQTSEGGQLGRPNVNGVGPLADDVQGTVDLSRYTAALRRYKWLMLAIVAVGTLGGVIATHFLKPEYTVQATIWIESPPEERGPIRSDELLGAGAWVELLTTYVVLDSVIQKERLFVEPAKPSDWKVFDHFGIATSGFLPGAYTLVTDATGRRYTLSREGGTYTESGTVGDSIGRKAGFQWVPGPRMLGPKRKVGFNLLTAREASTALLKRLRPQLAQKNFMRLQLSGTEPVRITSTLNTLAEQFVAVAADLKKRKLVELSKILAGQVNSIGEQLRVAEGRLEGYKVRTITLPSEATPLAPGIMSTQPTVMSNYFNQKIQLEELRHDREAIEAVLQRASSGALAVDAFQAIPSVRNAPDLGRALVELSTAEADLRALKYRYTDESKQVEMARAKIDTLRTRTIPAYATALATQLRTQGNDLGSRISSASKELQDIPARTITEQRLIREKQSIEGIYADLQMRYEAAKLAEASSVPDVRILDQAVQPDQPTRNSAPLIIGGALAASLVFAIALAILLDRLDKRFRYPDQVTRELGLSILGAVPAIRKVQAGDRDPDEASQVVESFRTIRMNLAHSYGSAGPVMLTISSPGAGDGKSIVSSNLALSFAEAGYKTLLVDGDIRRGELHRMFATERRPGLLDHLVGSASIDAIVRDTTHKNLQVIPCGTRLQHGPELLGSSAMRELMTVLKSRYSVLIVDSPPLGAGIDPFVLSTATGNIMLVLRSGETDRAMAEAKLKLLDRLPVRILGAVLNDIQLGGVYKYYSYIYGYTADEPSTPQLAGQAAKAEAPTS